MAAMGRIIHRTMTKPQYAGRWKTIRKQILERDRGICQIQAPGCTITATQVDHILPVAKGGPWHHPGNLRAACARCNNGRNRLVSKASRPW